MTIYRLEAILIKGYVYEKYTQLENPIWTFCLIHGSYALISWTAFPVPFELAGGDNIRCIL